MPSAVDRYQVNENGHSSLEDEKVVKAFPLLVDGGDFSARISSSSANEISGTQQKSADKLAQDHV